MEWVNATSLMRLSGLTYRQVDYWCRTGVLEPEGGGTPGSGSQRLFSPLEARVACALSTLRMVGMPMPVCRRVAVQLRLAEPDAWEREVFVTSDGWFSDSRPPVGWLIDLAELPEFDLVPA